MHIKHKQKHIPVSPVSVFGYQFNNSQNLVWKDLNKNQYLPELCNFHNTQVYVHVPFYYMQYLMAKNKKKRTGLWGFPSGIASYANRFLPVGEAEPLDSNTQEATDIAGAGYKGIAEAAWHEHWWKLVSD